MTAGREPWQGRSLTKIVATVGPACREPEMLARLVEAGVDVFRLNTAHASAEVHAETLERIRAVERRAGRPLAVLLDLAGPKIRLGKIEPDPFECKADRELQLVDRDTGEPGQLTTSFRGWVEDVQPGDKLVLADGTVELEVTRTAPGMLTCRVVGEGEVRSRQGINLPGAQLKVEALTEADRAYARWAVEHGVDFVGLSFVRSAEDVRSLKALLESHGAPLPVIAKIEKPQAIQHLEAIVDAADGVMVARGDLGVEIDVAEMPMQQKRIIDLCNQRYKPVIVATQMLDSMQHNKQPTRAEVTDVANAILDGTDACMLSGETAVGAYPVESVRMMNRIMLKTEPLLRERARAVRAGDLGAPVLPVTSAVVRAAGQVAQRTEARAVVISTRSGSTALAKSKQRDFIPTIAVSPDPATRRRMNLLWGINPLDECPDEFAGALIAFVADWGRRVAGFAPGERVVVVTGIGWERGSHNALLVYEIEDAPGSSTPPAGGAL